MSASAYEDFIDLVDICLACCYAPGSHTAENLAGMLSDVFEGLDLEPVVVGKRLTFMGKRVVKDFSRIFRLAVHDFGGGVPNAALCLAITGQHCSLHRFDLALKWALGQAANKDFTNVAVEVRDDVKAANEAYKKIRSLCAHFSASPIKHGELQTIKAELAALDEGGATWKRARGMNDGDPVSQRMTLTVSESRMWSGVSQVVSASTHETSIDTYFSGNDPYNDLRPTAADMKANRAAAAVLSVVRGPQQFLEAANRATMAVKQPFIHMVHKNLESDKVLDPCATASETYIEAPYAGWGSSIQNSLKHYFAAYHPKTTPPTVHEVICKESEDDTGESEAIADVLDEFFAGDKTLDDDDINQILADAIEGVFGEDPLVTAARAVETDYGVLAQDGHMSVEGLCELWDSFD